MERLTYRGKLNKKGYCENASCHRYCEDCEHFRRLLNKLADYEDAEEQGLLLRLPCKVGTEVWTIMCGMTGKNPILFKQEFEYSMIEHFGKAVFLTKEEAESALAEKGGAECVK